MREFPLGVVLSVLTTKMLCMFSDMHECCEFLVGGPVFTHQFAHKRFCDELSEGVFRQHPQLRDVDASGVTPDNWIEFLGEQIAQYGKTLPLAPFGKPPASSAASFTEPLAGKKVIAVRV